MSIWCLQKIGTDVYFYRFINKEHYLNCRANTKDNDYHNEINPEVFDNQCNVSSNFYGDFHAFIFDKDEQNHSSQDNNKDNKKDITMDIATTLLLNSTVSDLVTSKQSFTCWDVSRILTSKGCKISHKAVREWIHGTHGADLPPFRSTAYVRNHHVVLPIYGVATEVYTPPGVNPLSYNPDALDPNVTKPQSKVKTPKASKIKLKTPVGTKRKVIDSLRRTTTLNAKGRVTVNSNFLTSIGAAPSSDVYVARRTGKAPGLVLSTRPFNSGGITKYRTDCHNNVQLTASTLKKAGFSNTNTFKFRLTDDKRAIIVLEN